MLRGRRLEGQAAPEGIASVGRQEVGVDLAGDVTLEAADDLELGEPFVGPAGDVGLGVSRSTVYELIGSGDLEVGHIRRSARIPLDALHDFVRRLRAG